MAEQYKCGQCGRMSPEPLVRGGASMKKACWRFARVTARWLDQAGFTFLLVMIWNSSFSPSPALPAKRLGTSADEEPIDLPSQPLRRRIASRPVLLERKRFPEPA
jgi:hypothetical protein